MPGDDESLSDEAIWETLPVSLIILALIDGLSKLGRPLF